MENKELVEKIISIKKEKNRIATKAEMLSQSISITTAAQYMMSSQTTDPNAPE